MSLVKGVVEFTCQKTRVTQKRSKARREEITRLLKIDIYMSVADKCTQEVTTMRKMSETLLKTSP